MADDSMLEALQHSDQRAIRTVDSLVGDQWREASTLPGWTRAHVVGHLALNAEGFARALEGVQDGSPQPTYDSVEARDADIEELATADPAEIRDRYFAATARLRHAFGALTESQWSGTIARFPEGPVITVATIPEMRRYEVEIHHADLGAGYTASDWPADFTSHVLDRVSNESSWAAEPGFSVRATDLDRSWALGADSPVVTGTASSLAWWLLGRGGGQELTSDHGPLPDLRR